MLLPVSLLAVSNSLILVNCKKCILNFTDTFNSWFCNLLLWNILSFIHSFIHSLQFLLWVVCKGTQFYILWWNFCYPVFDICWVIWLKIFWCVVNYPDNILECFGCLLVFCWNWDWNFICFESGVMNLLLVFVFSASSAVLINGSNLSFVAINCKFFSFLTN